MENKNLIGKKIKGFKFDRESHIDFDQDMNSYIGKIGEIIDYDYDDTYFVLFEDKTGYWYPSSLIEQHLVDESPNAMDKAITQQFPKDDFGVIVQDNGKEIIDYLVSKGFKNNYRLSGTGTNKHFYFIKSTSNTIYCDDYNPTSKTFTLFELKAIDKAIESEFVLPKRWCIQVIGDWEKNQDVYKWRNEKWFNSGYISCNKVWFSEIECNHTEITIEQFKKYVLKEKPQTMTITTSKEVEINPNDIVVKNESESNPLDKQEIGVDKKEINYNKINVQICEDSLIGFYTEDTGICSFGNTFDDLVVNLISAKIAMDEAREKLSKEKEEHPKVLSENGNELTLFDIMLIHANENDVNDKQMNLIKEPNPLDNLPTIGEGVLMEVSNDGIDWRVKRFVFAKSGDCFYAHAHAESVEEINYNNEPSLYKHCRPIPKTKITRADFERQFEIID